MERKILPAGAKRASSASRDEVGVSTAVSSARKKLFWLGLAGMLMLGAGPGPSPGSTGVERELFFHPTKEYRPWVRWWWPGNDVTAEELRREIQLLDEAGFGGAEIQAFTMGLNPDAPAEVKERVLSFGMPSFYEHVAAALQEAKARGLQIDLTLGSGWPQGGLHISQELSSQTLLWNEREVQGPKKISLRPPAPKRPFFYLLAKVGDLIGQHLASYSPEDFQLIAVIAARPLGSSRHSWKPWNFADTVRLDFASLLDLSAQVQPDGKLKWSAPEGRWKLIFFYAGPTGVAPILVAETEPGLELDHLNSRAIQAHIRRVLEPGERWLLPYYGKTLRAFFTDSLELKAEQLWTHDFLTEFHKRRGYDLRPYLPAVPVPMKNNMMGHLGFYLQPEFDFPTGEAERLRYDVDRTVAELFQERFVAELSRAAEAKGLFSRLQAHGMQSDLLLNYGTSHIPETEQLYAGGATDFLKMAASAGHLYGRNLITAEAFVWNARDYMTTPLKLKAAADKLFTAGINGVIYHGFPYTYRAPGFGEQGWAPFSSPFMRWGTFSSNAGEANPFFKYLPLLNAYFSRVQYVLRQGETVTDVALFYPLFGYPQRTLVFEELTEGVLDESDAPLFYPGVLARIRQSGRPWPEHEWVIQNVRLADRLMAHGYNYDHINEDCLLRARVEDGRVRIGRSSYRVLVFNRIGRLPLPAVKKLEELAAQGAAIVFVDEIPKGQPGFKDYPANDAEIQAAIQRLLIGAGRVIRVAAEDLPDRLSRGLGIMPDLLYDRPQPSLDYIHRRTAGADYFFFRNASRQPLQAQVSFPCPGRVPEIWDPWTGEIKPAPDYRLAAGRVLLHLDLPAYGSLLLGFEQKPEELPPARTAFAFSGTMPPAVPIAAWTLTTEFRQPNGQTRPLKMELAQLQDWRGIDQLKFSSAPARYTAAVDLERNYFQAGLSLWLDLGEVRDAAEVKINGQPAGILLVPPFSCDATSFLKPGPNTIEILVTPTLFNQLVRFGNSGDQRYRQFKGRSNLMPSGLIGPVLVRAVPGT